MTKYGKMNLKKIALIGTSVFAFSPIFSQNLENKVSRVIPVNSAIERFNEFEQRIFSYNVGNYLEATVDSIIAPEEKLINEKETEVQNAKQHVDTLYEKKKIKNSKLHFIEARKEYKIGQKELIDKRKELADANKMLSESEDCAVGYLNEMRTTVEGLLEKESNNWKYNELKKILDDKIGIKEDEFQTSEGIYRATNKNGKELACVTVIIQTKDPASDFYKGSYGALGMAFDKAHGMLKEYVEEIKDKEIKRFKTNYYDPRKAIKISLGENKIKYTFCFFDFKHKDEVLPTLESLTK